MPFCKFMLGLSVGLLDRLPTNMKTLSTGCAQSIGLHRITVVSHNDSLMKRIIAVRGGDSGA
jgi:hypothetical protein